MMALWLYRLLLLCAEALLPLFSLFHRRAAALRTARKDGHDAFERAVIPENAEVWWFHCASLGEYEQARPVMQQLKRGNPKVFIALSFFSPSGYFPAKKSPDAQLVFCLPSDNPRNNRKVLQKLKPHAAVWVKYDFWFGYLNALHRRQIPLYVIAAVFRENHFLFRFPGRAFLPLLRACRYIFTQDAHSEALLHEQGFTEVKFTGDTRFDRVLQISAQSEPIPQAAVFKQESLLVVAGSSWPAEEALLHDYIVRHGLKGWKLILVPHDVSEPHIETIVTKFAPFGMKRWSQFDPADPGVHAVVVDSIGLLSRVYRHADIAVVGGGFRGALHNILEAAVYGLPVIFGPDTARYWEAQAAVEAGCGFQVKDAGSFSAALLHFLEEKPAREAAGLAAKTFIGRNSGATQRICEHFIPNTNVGGIQS